MSITSLSQEFSGLALNQDEASNDTTTAAPTLHALSAPGGDDEPKTETGGSGNDHLIGGDGDDTANGGGGDDHISGGAGNDWESGGDGNDSLDGGSGNDNLNGGGGNDSLNGGSGADTMAGGAGNDTYSVDNAGDHVTESSGSGTDTVDASVSYTLTDNVENLVLTGSSGINGSGNALANTLTGNTGANHLEGGGGNDNVSGGDGNDQLSGGDGSDHLSGGRGADTMLGGSGNDSLSGGDGNDSLDGGSGADQLSGGGGDDSYVVDSSGDVVTEAASAGTDTVHATVDYTLGANLENVDLEGTAAIDATGNTLDNTLVGNAGDNLLSGAAGNDSLSGGNGNDSLSGGSGNDKLSGGDGNDALNGGDGNDSLNGGGGTDTMTGGGGNDVYSVNSSTDKVVEASGGGTDSVQSSIDYTLGSNLENLTLTGSQALHATGNALANTITGNSGSDTLTGGEGADHFVFNNMLGSDTVSDFHSGIDKLMFSQGGIHLGDGDTALEGGVAVGTGGSFSAQAELAIFTHDISGSITADSAAAVIGHASGDFATGHTALFAVDNGTSSAVYGFQSHDGNAVVSASELTLVATLDHTASTALTDYAWMS